MSNLETSLTTGEPAALNDDSQLHYTQGIRRKIVNSLMPEGVVPGNDPDKLNQILATLKDHDKVTLTLKRIDADQENNSANALALAMFHQLAEINGAKDVMRKEPPEGTAAPKFDLAAIPDFDNTSAGNLRREADPVSYDTIMSEGSERLQRRLNEGA